MSRWKIEPIGVQGILKKVEADAEDLSKALTEKNFQGVLDGLLWGGALTQDVPKAVKAVMDDQLTNLKNIGNRIHAGLVGVSNAVIAYNNGQEEMTGKYQAEMLKSSTSGDFSYFTQHGYKG